MTATQNQELIRKIAKMLSSDNDGQCLAAVQALKVQAERHKMTMEELFFFGFGDLSALMGAPAAPPPVAPAGAAAGSSLRPPTQKDHDLFDILLRVWKSKDNKAAGYYNTYGRRNRGQQSGTAWNKMSPWEKNFITDIVERFEAHPFSFSTKQA